jgi:hypothetical protein
MTADKPRMVEESLVEVGYDGDRPMYRLAPQKGEHA